MVAIAPLALKHEQEMNEAFVVVVVVVFCSYEHVLVLQHHGDSEAGNGASLALEPHLTNVDSSTCSSCLLPFPFSFYLFVSYLREACCRRHSCSLER